MKIYLDVGHGGTEPSMEANSLKEKDVNLAVATKVREILILEGLDVMMSRTADTGTTTAENITNSANKCKAWNADYAYSIHHNGFNGEVVGYDICYSDFRTPTLAMANAIGEEYNKLGRPKHQIFTRVFLDDDGLYKDWYGIMRDMNCPCIITEYCYMDTPSEALLVNTQTGIDIEAMADARGILKFLRMSMPMVAPTNPLPVVVPPVVILPPYSDAKEISDWAVEDIQAARIAGIMIGGDGKFNPKALITREESAVAIMRAVRYAISKIK